MVSTIGIIIGIVALIVLVFVVLAFAPAIVTGGKINTVPTAEQLLSQKDLALNPSVSTQGLLGFNEGKVTVDSGIEEIKSNLITNNLTSEDAVRKLLEAEQNKVQVATDTGGSGTQTKEVEGTLLAKTTDSELRVAEAFAPAGEGQFLSIRGTPLAESSLVRTEETFGGTLTTEQGGTREIRGSKELFERLQQNLLSNS